MNVIKRVQAPTPKYFKVLRTIGLVLAGIGGSVIAAPVVLPATVVSIAGYLAVAGGVLSAVSQLTVDPSTPEDPSTSFRVTNDEILRSAQEDNEEDPKINSG